MAELPPIESFLLKSPIQQEDLEPEIDSEAVIRKLKGKKGDKGDQGIQGEKGDKGDKGDTGEQGIQGKDGKQGLKGERGVQGERGEVGAMPELEDLEAIILPLIPELKEQDISPKDLVEKINRAKTAKIKRDRIEGFDEVESIARSANKNVQNFISLGGTRQTHISLNGGAPLNGVTTLDFSGGTLVAKGDGSTATYTPPASGGGGSGYQAPLSGGLTGTNTWTTAPNVIVIDGVPKQQTSTDGTVNWTGTTTTVLSVTPNFDVFASA